MQFLWDGFLDAIGLLVQGDPLVISAAWLSLWISFVAVSIASVPGVANVSDEVIINLDFVAIAS